MKKLIGVLVLCMMMFTLAACGGSNDSNTLIYGSTDYTAINPALYEHGEINSLIFLGLTAHDSNNKIVPGAAASWEYDKSNYTYTFTLKGGLTFHDGEPLTSWDVKFTLDTIMNPENGSEIASNYEDISEIKVSDDLNISITLTTPNVAMPDYLTVGILPQHLLEGKDIVTDGFNQEPIGAGPYKLTDWDFGQSITLEAFDNFCMGKADIKKVVFKIINDSDARALQLKSGEIDFAQVTPKAAAEFTDDKKYRVYIMDTADYRGIMYNFNSDFFSKHPELPSILSYAIDREAIVDSVLLGYGQVAYSPLQKNHYNNPAIEKYEYNPKKCKQLLEAADWQLGEDGYYYKNGEQLAFEICNGQADQVRIDMSNICAQNLQEVGANAVVKVKAETDWAKQDTYLIGWGSPFDPDDHTYKVFATNKGANYGSYSNAEVDRLLTEARETDEDGKRVVLYKQFQTELSKDVPYTFIAYIDAMYVSNADIKGISENMTLGHHGVGIFNNIYDWSLEK